MTDKSEELKKRILKEMTANYADALEKNFELAKKFIRITSEGKIDITMKDELDNKDKILVYLIGKQYAMKADLTSNEGAGNKELISELGMPEGSVKSALKSLRDERKVKRLTAEKNVQHSIKINIIEKTLKSINKKLEGFVKNDNK